jgi:hypothetical protein
LPPLHQLAVALEAQVSQMMQEATVLQAALAVVEVHTELVVVDLKKLVEQVLLGKVMLAVTLCLIIGLVVVAAEQEQLVKTHQVQIVTLVLLVMVVLVFLHLLLVLR